MSIAPALSPLAIAAPARPFTHRFRRFVAREAPPAAPSCYSRSHFDDGEEAIQAAKIAAAAGTTALVAGCATAPDSTAQAQCQYFAGNDGFGFVRVVSSTPTADGAGETAAPPATK